MEITNMIKMNIPPSFSDSCAHITIIYKTQENDNGLTNQWWECADCKHRFVPVPIARKGETHIATDQEKLSVIDAAMDVYSFSKFKKYPEMGTTDFYKFAELLCTLEMKLTRAYPQFIKNQQAQEKKGQVGG